MNNNGEAQVSYRFLSFKEVQKMTGLSRSTIYWQVKRGVFPRPRILSEKKVGFLKRDLDNWFQEREFTTMEAKC